MPRLVEVESGDSQLPAIAGINPNMLTFDLFLGIAFPVFIGIGIALAMSPASVHEIFAAKICFAVAGAIATGFSLYWASTMEYSTVIRYAIAAGLGGFLFAATLGALDWVNYRAKPFKHKGSLVATYQPTLLLFAPKERFELRWEPSLAYGPSIRPQSQEFRLGQSTFPGFTLRNASETPAQDVSVTWEAETGGIKEAIGNSTRLEDHKVEFVGDEVVIGNKQGTASHTNDYSTASTYTLSHVTDEVTAYVASPVLHAMELYVLATLPVEYGEAGPPFYFNVSVSWKIPRGGEATRFRVKATPVNSKPPNILAPPFLATIGFEVED